MRASGSRQRSGFNNNRVHIREGIEMDNHGKARHLVQMDASVAGPLFMLSAALLFTLLNVFVKLLGPAFTVWHIGFFRFFGGLVVLLSLFGRRGNPFRGVNTRLLIIRGCVGSVTFISLVTAIRLLPLSTALVIFYSFPAFSAVFSFLIYGERIGALELTCIAVVVIGVGVIFDFQLAGGLMGQIMAVTAGVFGGLTVTLIRSLREKNGPVIIYLYFCTMGAIITFPYFIMHPILPSTPMEWIMVLGIVFSSAMAQLLMNQGFFYCRGWEGGVFMSSEVIFTALVGIVFLGDTATLRFWIGGLMIFGSVVALNRLKANG
jgi:drug/metabolite transporter (DMT)-like permease